MKNHQSTITNFRFCLLSLRSRFLLVVLAVSAFTASATEFSQTSDSGITHSFLATGGHTYIMQADKDDPKGKIVWEYPAGTREGCILANGNVLLAVSKGGQYPGGAAVEVTRDKKTVWEYKGTQEELNSVNKTPEGTYVVTES